MAYLPFTRRPSTVPYACAVWACVCRLCGFTVKANPLMLVHLNACALWRPVFTWILYNWWAVDQVPRLPSVHAAICDDDPKLPLSAALKNAKIETMTVFDGWVLIAIVYARTTYLGTVLLESLKNLKYSTAVLSQLKWTACTAYILTRQFQQSDDAGLFFWGLWLVSLKTKSVSRDIIGLNGNW